MDRIIKPISYRVESPFEFPENPFFSVLIPTLNEKGYLMRLLTQLYNQDFRNFEIIVADSFSEDGTIKVAESFGCIIVEVPKLGPSLARRAGSDIARGKYLIFIDCDAQILEYDFLGNLADRLETYDIDFATVTFKPSQDTWLYWLMSNIRNGGLREGRSNFATGVFLIIKKSVDEEIGGFDPEIQSGEDGEYIKRVIASGRKLYFIEDLYIIESVRRFEEEGALTTVAKWGMLELMGSFLGRKNVKKSPFEYKMGIHGQTELIGR